MRDAQRAYDCAEPDEARCDECPLCEGSGSELAEDRDGIFEVTCHRCGGDGTVRT
jgi:DnaJ-class molecular chaperone